MKRFSKIFIYLGVVIVVGLIIYFMWTFFVPKPVPPATPATTTGGSLPTGGTTGGTIGTSTATTSAVSAPTLTKISDHDVFYYWIDPQTGDVEYLGTDGEVWNAKNGGDVSESQQIVSALRSAEVYQNGQEVLVSFGDPASPQWAIYNTVDKTWHSLPQSIENATWGANQNQLIAFTKNIDSYSLAYVDLTKNPPSFKTIMNNVYFHNAVLAFSAPGTLIITERPSNSYQGSVWELNLKTLSLNMLLEPQNGLFAEPSDDGSLIYETANGTTSIINASTLQPSNLPFPSLPNKCDLSANASSSSIYCFSPENLTQNITMPDDYLMKAFYTIDILYNYQFSSGNTRAVILSGAPGIPMLDATDVTSFGNNVYFVNRYDQSLYQLALPAPSSK